MSISQIIINTSISFSSFLKFASIFGEKKGKAVIKSGKVIYNTLASELLSKRENVKTFVLIV